MGWTDGKKPDPNSGILQAIAAFKAEILQEIEGLRGLIIYIGAKMEIDTSKLQAADAAIQSQIQSLGQVLTDETAKIQAAIDALAAQGSTDPAVQAAIDKATADITDSTATLANIGAKIQGLPTTTTQPTP